jgi:uncharacterized lipoprotein NlpE involved in copper resistance
VLAERALRESNETLERRVNEALAERKILVDIVEGTNRLRLRRGSRLSAARHQQRRGERVRAHFRRPSEDGR